MKTQQHSIETVKRTVKGRGKVYSLEDLSEIVASLKAQGKRIIHCHGVFDLLHVGHIRHLEEAKALGDILVVSVTEDGFVNKGPHRPAFTESLRTEALAALASVHFVAISRAATAIKAITLLKPDVYVKGPDYKDPSGDVTGGINLEEQAVHDVGGRLHYTDSVTFSSSKLINRYLPTFTDEIEEYLHNFRSSYTAKDVIQYIERLRNLDVLVVGEAILDEYIYCEQMGKSAKDPVLAMRYNSCELYAGGSLAVANHLANFVNSVKLVTYLGSENTQEAFVREHLKPNVSPHFIIKSQSPTIVKRRYVESHLRSKHFEVYFINDDPINDIEERELCRLLDQHLTTSDMVIASDFGHGLLTNTAISHLAKSDRFLAVNTQINAANIRYHSISAYERADYICVNEQEVRLDARSRRGELSTLVQDLASRLVCERLLVTRGSAGATYFDKQENFTSPSFASEVVDRTGSGDAVLAITAGLVAVGAPGPIVAFAANVIGAQKVQIIGNRSAVDRISTLKFIESLLK